MKLIFSSLTGFAFLLASFCAADEVLFQDDFAGKLGDGWSWVREEKPGWRIADKTLEIRVLPGNLWGRANNVKNVLVRQAPDTAQGEVEVSVIIANRPSHQYEQANLAWYYDDSNMVKLGLELVNGEACICHGPRRGRQDNARWRRFPSRRRRCACVVRVAGNQIRGQYRVTGTDAWLDAGGGRTAGAAEHSGEDQSPLLPEARPTPSIGPGSPSSGCRASANKLHVVKHRLHHSAMKNSLSLLLLPFLITSRIVAGEIAVVREEARIPLGQTRSFEFGTLPQKDTTVLLDVSSRLDAKGFGGSSYFIKLTLNGRVVNAAKTRAVSRLVNKPVVSPVGANLPYSWFGNGSCARPLRAGF